MIEPPAIQFQHVETPIGRILVAGDDLAVRHVRFERDNAPGPLWVPARGGPVGQAARELNEYFAGKREHFEVAAVPAGTEFQLRVWKQLRTIPYGETTSYGELARRIGQPTASRAVGAANGANPIPIIIPCHRAVGADGSMTGFGGGITVKRKLLALEAGQRALA